MQRILIICNPQSGNFSDIKVEKVKALFDKHKISISIYKTKKNEEMQQHVQNVHGENMMLSLL